MHKLLMANAAILLAYCAPTWPMDGEFDRTAEIARLSQAFQTGTRATVISAARELYVAGITDATLATQIGARISSEVAGVAISDRIGQQYLEWMARGLASTGVDASVKVLLDAAKRAKSQGTRSYYDDEAEKVAWYKRRNELMASRRNFAEGDDPEVARLLNLLMSDDFSHKLYAADRMNWAHKFDPKLMEEVNAQLLHHMSDKTSRTLRDQDKTAEKTFDLYVKLLGFSGNTAYRDTLNKVIATASSPFMKAHAKESLDRLRQ